mgnify:CR=1 FL=1|jgi:membrane protein implicated in regulation of membrane protease activity
MDTMVGIWWVWLSAAIALAVLEVFAPGFIFIGFAIGALVMTAVVALFPAAMMVPAALALFTGLSLVAWIILKRVFKSQSSGERRVKYDIND